MIKTCGSACYSEQRLYEYTMKTYIYVIGSAIHVAVIYHEIPQLLQKLSYTVRKASEHTSLVGAALGDREVFAWL